MRRNDLLRGSAFFLVVALGLLTILVLPRGGSSHLSYDSIRYLAGAEALLSKGQYQSYTGLVDLHFPPGTSLAYAGIARLFACDPESLVLQINCGSYLLLSLELLPLSHCGTTAGPP